jgi:hypothetical protein
MEKEKEKTKPNHRALKSETHDASARCKAVLSVWMESRKPTEVCRELGVKWMTLMHWQKRAMEGMLQALTPRAPLTQGHALPPKVLDMLARQEALLKARLSETAANRLTKRLQRIQETRQAPESVNASAAKQ